MVKIKQIFQAKPEQIRNVQIRNKKGEGRALPSPSPENAAYIGARLLARSQGCAPLPLNPSPTRPHFTPTPPAARREASEKLLFFGDR
jgi:hypothetical protein